MPRVSTIEKHPKRAEIEQALLDRDTFRSIAEKYDVSQAALIRYHDSPEMARKMAKTIEKRELGDGLRILRWVDETAERVKMLLDACHEYLLDPDDPKKYNLHARAEEVIVTVQRQYDKGEMVPPKYRVSLGEAMEQLEEKGYIVHSLKYGHADPRTLILQAAKSLEGISQLLINFAAELRLQQQADITKHPEYRRLEHMLAEALGPFPEARKALLDVISS